MDTDRIITVVCPLIITGIAVYHITKSYILESYIKNTINNANK